MIKLLLYIFLAPFYIFFYLIYFVISIIVGLFAGFFSKSTEISKSKNSLNERNTQLKKVYDSQDFKFCTNCGTKLRNKANFCTNCGNKLNDTVNNDIKDNTPKLTKTIFSEYDDSLYEKINDFNKCLYIANQQKTHELLEILIEFEDLDRAYIKVKNIKPNFMPRNLYDETKLNILDNIINDKFRKYSSNKKKKSEKMKSLLDELYVCKRRYPEYKEILDKHIINISNSINDN